MPGWPENCRRAQQGHKKKERMISVYRHECPKCSGALYVVSGVFDAYKMRLYPDGFSFDEAQNIHTSDEQVICGECGYQADLVDLIID